LAGTSILGNAICFPSLRTVAPIVMVPMGKSGTSAKPTFVPFGTAVAEQAESGSLPLQLWSTVSLPADSWTL
jgi:hypothetical protein